MSDILPSTAFVDRVNRGTDSAAVEVERRYRDKLCRLVQTEMARCLRAREDPEDVVQTVFRTSFPPAPPRASFISSVPATCGPCCPRSRVTRFSSGRSTTAKKTQPEGRRARRRRGTACGQRARSAGCRGPDRPGGEDPEGLGRPVCRNLPVAHSGLHGAGNSPAFAGQQGSRPLPAEVHSRPAGTAATGGRGMNRRSPSPQGFRLRERDTGGSGKASSNFVHTPSRR